METALVGVWSRGAGRDPIRLRSGQAFDCVVGRFANDNFAQDDRRWGL